MSALIQDTRYALRQLSKSPGFALVAIVMLGMGICARLGIFAFADTQTLLSGGLGIFQRSRPWPPFLQFSALLPAICRARRAVKIGTTVALRYE